jgi:DNA-binding GntR family transcriptional regulator
MLYGWSFHLTEEAREELLKYSERDLERHFQLLEALEARDGEQARRVVEKYVQEVWESTKRFLPRSDEHDKDYSG